MELNIEVAEEALRDVGLTPQEVKADMKRYITICEKKIASQQELCEQLQEQVNQLTDVGKCIVAHPKFLELAASAFVLLFYGEQTINRQPGYRLGDS